MEKSGASARFDKLSLTRICLDAIRTKVLGGKCDPEALA